MNGDNSTANLYPSIIPPYRGWLILLPVIVLVLIVTSPGSSMAQSPNNPTACDNMLNDTLSELRLRMAEHWLMYGKPWQGLPTHSTPPVQATAPDQFTFSPSDEPISWADFAGDVLPEEMPCSLRIDVFDRGTERGYVLTASYTANETATINRDSTSKQRPPRDQIIYDRQIGIGPVGNVNQSWHRRPDPPGHSK